MSNNLFEVAKSISGHIKNPYSPDEIAWMLKNGDYSAEIMLQHLLALMTKQEYVQKFLKVTYEHSIFQEVSWKIEPEIKFYVNCFDLWGAAEEEPVETLEDVENLDRACRESEDWGAQLYCARRRGKRPHANWYRGLEEKDRDLFNQCGPK